MPASSTVSEIHAPIVSADEAFTPVGRVETSRPAHLPYLDGIRGLAALYVVLSHIGLYMSPHLAPALLIATRWMRLGRCSVSIFIVLSGYCLMLPVVRAPEGTLRGGIGEFVKRRARRILPPYYAAFILALLMAGIAPRDWIARNTWWHTMQPSFTVGSLVSHLTLTHNLFAQWIYKTDGVLWSVGMEWQIYFIFALVLLPLWQRWGLKAAVPAGFVMGLAPMLLLHRLEWTSPWYTGLFALGMAGAVINYSSQPRFQRLRERISWGTIALAMFLPFGLLAAMGKISAWDDKWKIQFGQDFWVGLACMCLLIYCTRQMLTSHTARPPLVLRVLQMPAVVRLGAFSYSLYLVHALVLVLVYSAIQPLHLASNTEFLTLLGMVVPLSLIAAYGFHLLFEKPFMKTAIKQKTLLQPTIISPADRIYDRENT